MEMHCIYKFHNGIKIAHSCIIIYSSNQIQHKCDNTIVGVYPMHYIPAEQ